MKYFNNLNSKQIVILCCLITLIVLSAILFSPYSLFTGADKSLTKAPYPPSAVIKNINWDFASATRLAPGSDLWPVTWGQDDKLYVSWGDGGGFGGANRKGRVSMGIARIDGVPPDFTTENINGGVNPKNGSTWDCSHCGKTASILSVDGVLYSWINIQNAVKPDSKLAWSQDQGETWKFVDWHFSGEGKFVPGAFANFGRGYKGAKDNYIYIYGSDRSDWRNLYLVRVYKKQVKERTSYEFFSGIDNLENPTWSKDINDRHNVAYDPDGMGALAVVYSTAIGRYLLTTHHGNYVGRFGFFDGPNPWGPWTTVGYYNNWGNYGRVKSGMPHSFPAKWISSDGKEMYMIFSGTGDLDSFNLIKVRLELWKN